MRAEVGNERVKWHEDSLPFVWLGVKERRVGSGVPLVVVLKHKLVRVTIATHSQLDAVIGFQVQRWFEIAEISTYINESTTPRIVQVSTGGATRWNRPGITSEEGISRMDITQVNEMLSVRALCPPSDGP